MNTLKKSNDYGRRMFRTGPYPTQWIDDIEMVAGRVGADDDDDDF